MAGEVSPQSDVDQTGGTKTLHLKTLRRSWQILALQVIATVSLVWMYMIIVSTYVVDSIDHTILFQTLASFGWENPLGDFITGSRGNGLAKFFIPLLLGLSFGGGMALLAFQSQKVQQRIKLGFIIVLIVGLVGRTMLSWLGGMLFQWEIRAPNSNEIEMLQWPLMMILSLLIMTIYLLPIIAGTRGIWGLSKQAIAWSIGFTLLFLGIHAVLTFPTIMGQLGTYGDTLSTLDTQIGEATIGIFGFDLISRQQLSLVLIAVLIMAFQESAFAVIRYLEYAYRLPESCKRDPEYVKQMDNALNGHLRHTIGFLVLTAFATMIALGFHSILLDIVEATTGSQWAAQVSESIELRLTYGLVISALLFLGVASVVKYLVPWQRVRSVFYSVTRGETNTESVKKEDVWTQ